MGCVARRLSCSRNRGLKHQAGDRGGKGLTPRAPIVSQRDKRLGRRVVACGESTVLRRNHGLHGQNFARVLPRGGFFVNS